MNEFLNWLFGLGPEGLRFGDEGVALSFARGLPAWAWVLMIVALAAGAWWTYRRLMAPLNARRWLAATRAVSLVVLLFLFTGPELRRESSRSERDWLVVLIDRSLSLTSPDAPAPGGRQTREAQLRSLLAEAGPAFDAIAENKRLLVLGFDAGAFDLQPAGTEASPQARPQAPQRGGAVDPGSLAEPVGRRTALGAALDQALRRVAARPLSGVVVLSDGRSADEVSRQALRRLQAEQVPVFTVPLGSEDAPGDLALARIDAPDLVFAGDSVPVTVTVRSTGAAAPGGVVRLVDRRTGEVVAETPLPEPDASGNARAVLLDRPDDAGARDYAVRIVPDGDDLVTENNTQSLAFEVVDRPLRALYLDGYPRWERRYLTALLLREPSIASSSLMLATDRRFIQEGDVNLAVLPRSAEEWAEFDVVILGDLRADLFSAEQLENLRTHIAERGAGLLLIAGPGAMPRGWAESPLADLLPVAVASGGIAERFDTPVTLSPTPLADRLGLLRFEPVDIADPALGWTNLRYAQRYSDGEIKPAAEVLAAAGGVEDPQPLVLSMRYGAGRVMLVGTDELWRYRYGRGEARYEAFWLPLIRFLGRESLQRSGRAALLELSPDQAVVNQPVRVSLELIDQSLIDTRPERVRVRLERRDGGSADSSSTIEATLTPEAGSGRDYAATFLPLEPGVWRAVVTEPGLSGLELAAEVEVALPDDELRRPEADHATLRLLSDATGGLVLADGLADLGELLPNRSALIPGPTRTEPLWDKWVWLILMGLLLGGEWIGRKLAKLS